MSIIGVPMVMGPIMGPVIGGLIVSNYSWRWIFYINVPIGIVTLDPLQPLAPEVRHRRALPHRLRHARLLPPVTRPRRTALLALRGRDHRLLHEPVRAHQRRPRGAADGGFHPPRAPRQASAARPAPVPHRNFAIANVCIFVIGATLFGSMFLLPIYYQVARGQEAWVAGLLLAPQGIGAACIMRWAGSITDRLGPRRVVPFGILLMAAATVPFAFVTANTSRGFSP